MKSGCKKRTRRSLSAPGTVALARESLAWLFAGLLLAYIHLPARADGPSITNVSTSAPSYISEMASPVMGESGQAGAGSLSSLSQLLASQSAAPLALGLNMAQGGQVAASNSALGNPGL